MFCTVCFFFFLLLWHICSIHIWDLIFLSWEVTVYLNWRDFILFMLTFLLVITYCLLWSGDALILLQTTFAKFNCFMIKTTYSNRFSCEYVKTFKRVYFFVKGPRKLVLKIWVEDANDFLGTKKKNLTCRHLIYRIFSGRNYYNFRNKLFKLKKYYHL